MFLHSCGRGRTRGARRTGFKHWRCLSHPALPCSLPHLQRMLRASSRRASCSPGASKAEHIPDAIAWAGHHAALFQGALPQDRPPLVPNQLFQWSTCCVRTAAFSSPMPACRPWLAWLALLGQKPLMRSALFFIPAGFSFIHIPFGLKLQAVSSLRLLSTVPATPKDLGQALAEEASGRQPLTQTPQHHLFSTAKTRRFGTCSWHFSHRQWLLCRLPSLPSPPLCLPRCVALHSYMAHGPDELELQKGEGVRIFGKYHDGWLRGMSLVTGRVGIFPSNYVAPLFRSDFSYMEQRHVERGGSRVGCCAFSSPRWNHCTGFLQH